MAPILDPKWVPKSWRSAYTLAALAATILGAGGTALAVVHVEAGRVVDAKWDSAFRSEVKSIATEAAVAAGRDAVLQVSREEIGPLRERGAVDAQRVKALEDTVLVCCPVAPRGPYSAPPPAPVSR